MKTGTVKWFDTTKAFGFIKPDEGDKDIFVHQSDLVDGTIRENDKVEFETEEDYRKKVETIKESYFTKKAEVVAEAKTEPTEESSEPLVEETTSSTMSKYVDAIARWSK